jgi:bifunctional DNA-binding transcriptional regulator/antitoxin component of YhaV-PrlF toxin-antitoxin module
MKVVKLSSQGQITIPRKYRIHDHFLISRENGAIVLKPVEVKIIEDRNDELADFGFLSKNSFEFWGNEKDDVYQDFYKKQNKDV